MKTMCNIMLIPPAHSDLTCRATYVLGTNMILHFFQSCVISKNGQVSKPRGRDSQSVKTREYQVCDKYEVENFVL